MDRILRVVVLAAWGLLSSSTGLAQVVMQDGFPVWPGSPPRTLTVANLDGDEFLEILVPDTSSSLMSALDSDGTSLAGWAYDLSTIYPGLRHQELMHVGDITGDGSPEIVYLSANESHFLFAVDNTGELLPGWPIAVAGGGQPLGRIVLADLTGDGVSEVLIQDRGFAGNSMIWVYDGNGNVLPGWPQVVSNLAAGLAVGDLEFDGEPEIVVSTADSTDIEAGPNPVYVFQADGTLRQGWPTLIDDQFASGSLINVTIADLDGDYRCEIFGTAWNALYVLDSDGNLSAPPVYGISPVRPPSVGDLDGDGTLEVIIPWTGLAIYNLAKDIVRQIPAGGEYFSYDGVVIADLDGDGSCEIAARSRFPTRAVHVWNQFLEPLPGYPVFPVDTSVPPRRLMAITDLDGDNDLELIYTNGQYMDAIDLPNATGNPPRIEWGHYYHDPQRTGNYHFGRPPGPRFLRGDTNRNGQVDLDDVFVELDYLRGAISEDCPARHDFGGDGQVDLTDAIDLLRYLFLSGAPPAVPFPQCREVHGEPLPCAWEACP